ncbi:protein kinase domain-containing protein [Kitasatospora sp. LaBMicrA B282]|uniref:protein kinase domain-containing protein n=1 Tax=Kitasatospora sp. LaBMicrA B282 TaxID=3420949 RepID=UPI003D111D04
MIGRALNGRYELVGTLGAGGMATVYLGTDRVLGRQVAVKVLNGGLAEDPRFAERFSREAQHAAMLVHPRIAMVFDSGMDQGSPYIVMELIRGRSLGSEIAEQGPLPVERAVGIAAAVCEALEVAHAAGLVHRDIKPANVMITDDGGVKVVDFGIARASDGGQQLTQTATVLGTAAYLSPEQATAGEVDGRADLYALGCVLTEMLTGEPPFTADTPVAVAFKQVSEDAPPVSRRRPEVPPALDHVVARLLAKSPANRPAGAGAARGELLAAVPVAGAVDRTSELLATPPLAAGDGDRTTVLPMGSAASGPADPRPFPGGSAPTSVMAPLPEYPGGGAGGTGGLGGLQLNGGDGAGDRRGGGRSRRTMALVLGGAGLAVVALVGVLALASNSSSGNGQHGGKPVAATAPANDVPPPSTQPVGGAPTPPTGPATSAKPSPATPVAEIAALRAEMAGTAMPKERQAPLLHTMDVALAAETGGKPQDAVQALKAAQKQVRDLSKKHVVDGQVAGAWQHQLGTIIGQLNTEAGGANAAPTDQPGPATTADPTGADGGDNGGN